METEGNFYDFEIWNWEILELCCHAERPFMKTSFQYQGGF